MHSYWDGLRIGPVIVDAEEVVSIAALDAIRQRARDTTADCVHCMHLAAVEGGVDRRIERRAMRFRSGVGHGWRKYSPPPRNHDTPKAGSHRLSPWDRSPSKEASR